MKNKLVLLEEKLLAARKSNDVIVKNLLTTLKGEIETQLKNTWNAIVTDGTASIDDVIDEVVEGKAKSFKKSINVMIKSMEGKDTSVQLQELAALEPFLPTAMSEDDIRKFIDSQDDKSMKNIMKLLKGKADGSTVLGVINSMK